MRNLLAVLGCLMLMTGGLSETGEDGGGCGASQCDHDCKGAKDEAACVKACESPAKPYSPEM